MSKKVKVSSTEEVTRRTGLKLLMEMEVMEALVSFEEEVVVQIGLSLPLIRSHTLNQGILTPGCLRLCRQPFCSSPSTRMSGCS